MSFETFVLTRIPSQARVLEEFDEPGLFDAVVASRSLHHVADLDAAVEKIDSLLVRGGLVVLDDYTKERFGRRDGRLVLRARRTIAAGGGLGAPASVEECEREWEATTPLRRLGRNAEAAAPTSARRPWRRRTPSGSSSASVAAVSRAELSRDGQRSVSPECGDYAGEDES